MGGNRYVSSAHSDRCKVPDGHAEGNELTPIGAGPDVELYHRQQPPGYSVGRI